MRCKLQINLHKAERMIDACLARDIVQQPSGTMRATALYDAAHFPFLAWQFFRSYRWSKRRCTGELWDRLLRPRIFKRPIRHRQRWRRLELSGQPVGGSGQEAGRAVVVARLEWITEAACAGRLGH